MLRTALLGLTLPILASSAAWSQEPATREEADRQRREEKAKETKPYEPNGFEKAMNFAEDKAIFILDREGFHPKLGSLTTGSGFAYGLGFRDRDLFSHTGALEIWGAGSVKRYWATEARLTFPRLANNHLHLETWASHRDYPQENFFGLGPDSERGDRSDYAIRTNHFGGRVGVRPTARHLLVGGGIEYLEPRLGAGKNDKYPDVTEIFPPSDVPGIDTQADFLRSEAFIEVDYREPRYPKKGGWYRIDFSHYDDRTAGQFTFNRLDADLRLHAVIAGMDVRDEAFEPVCDELHRTPEQLRERDRRHLVRIGVHLDAERAADILGDDPHLLVFDAEVLGEQVLHHVRGLGGVINGQALLALVPVGHDGARLVADAGMAAEAECRLDHFV